MEDGKFYDFMCEVRTKLDGLAASRKGLLICDLFGFKKMSVDMVDEWDGQGMWFRLAVRSELPIPPDVVYCLQKLFGAILEPVDAAHEIGDGYVCFRMRLPESEQDFKTFYLDD